MRLACMLLALCASTATAQTTRALIVSGVAGDPRLAAQFQQDGRAVRDALVQRFAAQATLLSESSQPRSDQSAIKAAFARLAAESKDGDQIVVVFIGHGSTQGGNPRINLPGPDLSATDLARLLDPLAGRTTAVVMATSASGAFTSALASPRRIIMTATRSGAQDEEVVFARFFAQALSEDVADANKDGSLSIAEVFEYAQREVARFYQQQNRLATEHAQLDNRGEAERFLLRTGGGVVANAELQTIQRQIDALKARKASMAEAEYDAQLETLLLELARKTRELRGRND